MFGFTMLHSSYTWSMVWVILFWQNVGMQVWVEYIFWHIQWRTDLPCQTSALHWDRLTQVETASTANMTIETEDATTQHDESPPIGHILHIHINPFSRDCYYTSWGCECWEVFQVRTFSSALVLEEMEERHVAALSSAQQQQQHLVCIPVQS